MDTSLSILVLQSADESFDIQTPLSHVEEFQFKIDEVSTLSEAELQIAANHYDAVIITLKQSTKGDAEKISELRKKFPKMPLVVIADDANVINDAVASGADNHIVGQIHDGNRFARGILFAIQQRSAAEVLDNGSKSQSFFSKLEKDVSEVLRDGGLLKDALTQFVRALEIQMGDTFKASLLLLNRETSRLYLAAAPSLPTAYNEAIDGLKIGPSAGSCGTAAFMKHAIYVVDVSTDPLWGAFREPARRNGLRACWSAPVFDEIDDVIGTFAIYSSEMRSPSSEEIEFIHAASKSASQILLLAHKLKGSPAKA